jgi:hypothetical protein
MSDRIPVYLTRLQIDALLYAVVEQESAWEGLDTWEWDRVLAARRRCLLNADKALRAAFRETDRK